MNKEAGELNSRMNANIDLEPKPGGFGEVSASGRGPSVDMVGRTSY